MIWLPILLLAAACLAGVALAARVPLAGWQVVGAALLFGLAGYAWQGRPGLAGAPRGERPVALGDAGAAVEERKLFTHETMAPSAGQFFLIVADAMSRHGDDAGAATMLRGATERNPNDATAWLALGNALVRHAAGTLSPAAQYAYARAAGADPAAPGPPFFLALAMAGSGQYAAAKDIWARLAARTPADAPWRADLQHRLAQVDAAILMSRALGVAGN